MGIFSRQPLRRQILAGAGLLLLPFLIVVAVASDRSRLERRAEVGGEAVAAATAAAAYLDERFNTLATVAQMLARHPAVVTLDRDMTRQLFKDAQATRPFLTDVMLIAPGGSLVASSVGPEPGATPAWLIAQQVGSDAIGPWRVIDLPRDGAAAATVALLLPVQVSTSPGAGTLSLTIDLEQFASPFSTMPLPDDAAVTIADRAGRILTRSIDGTAHAGEMVAFLANATSGVSTHLDVDGVSRLQSIATPALAPWVVSVGIPEAEVTRRLRPLWYRNIAISVGAFLASVLMSLWIASKMSHHLEHLRGAAQRIAAGDLSGSIPPVTVQTRELADLQSAFAQMAANLRASRALVHQQLEHERALNDELQSLQRQVVRQERMAAVGQLAAGLAHELSNPLQAIVGAAHLLDRNASLDVESKAEIELVKAQSVRAVTIIRSLSRFGAHQRSEPAPVDLAEVVEDIAELQAAEGDAPVVSVAISSRGRRVYASFTELQQVVFNLLANARYAVATLSRNEARVEIRVSDVGRWIRLEVADNGNGIAPENEGKLFQPFFTTRPVGEGRGLGLSISHGIIQSCGGTIGYVPNEWGGATFFFELPCVEGEATATYDGAAVLRRLV